MNIIKRLYLKYVSYRLMGKHIFTRDVLQHPNYHIGVYTYGWPDVLFADSGKKLQVGNYCSIAYGVKIFLGGNHRPEWVSTYPFSKVPNVFTKANPGFHTSKGDVVIGNDVWIGHGATILPGVTIGDGAVIGANATIAKNVGPYEVVVGNPQVVVKKRFSDEVITALLQIKWWHWEAAKINDNMHLICSDHIEEFIKMHQ